MHIAEMHNTIHYKQSAKCAVLLFIIGEMMGLFGGFINGFNAADSHCQSQACIESVHHMEHIVNLITSLMLFTTYIIGLAIYGIRLKNHHTINILCATSFIFIFVIFDSFFIDRDFVNTLLNDFYVFILSLFSIALAKFYIFFIKKQEAASVAQ